MARQITLTDEVAALVDEQSQRTGVPVDQVANEAIRKTLGEPYEIRGPFVRTRPGTNYDFTKVEALLDEVEGPMRK